MPDTNAATPPPDLLSDLCRRLVEARERGVRFALLAHGMIRTTDACEDCPVIRVSKLCGLPHPAGDGAEWVNQNVCHAAWLLWPDRDKSGDFACVLMAIDNAPDHDPLIRRRLLEACGVEE